MNQYASNQFTLKRTVEPAALVVSVEEARRHANISETFDDLKVFDLIQSATSWVEDAVRRAFITQTWRHRLDNWPCYGDWNPFRKIALPRPPLQSVSSITYIDSDGVTQTWGSSNYTVQTDDEPGSISLAYGAEFPVVRNVPFPIAITYVAGYGATGLTVPARSRQLLRLLITHWYENPQAVITGTVSKEIELGVRALLDAESVGDLIIQ